jgi:hypothetical protein
MFFSITRTVSLSACLGMLALIGGAAAQPITGYGPPAPEPIYPYAPHSYAPDYFPNYAPSYELPHPSYTPSYEPYYPAPGYGTYPPTPHLDGPYATEGFQQSGSSVRPFGSFNVPNFQPNSSNNSISRFGNPGRSPFANSGGVAPRVRPCSTYYGTYC